MGKKSASNSTKSCTDPACTSHHASTPTPQASKTPARRIVGRWGVPIMGVVLKPHGFT